MMTPKQKQELYGLLNALCEGTITDDAFDRLDHWIRSDREACELYVDFTSVWSDLQYFQASLYSQNHRNTHSIQEMISGLDSFTDSAIWEALADAEKEAPAIEITAPEEPKILIQKIQHQKVVRKISKSSLFSLFAAAAAIILIFVFSRFTPVPVQPEVATIADMINARWANADSVMQKETRLRADGELLLLREGVVELRFDTSARIVIEAPAEFQVLSYEQIKLHYGRLYATVPNKSLGFIVSTPNSRIIDLGTEFGVQADVNGTTELHVLKGKTLLTAAGPGEKSVLDVIAGQARKVLAGSNCIQTIPLQDNTFVRKIDSKTHFIWKGQTWLSLTDMLMGGDGYYTATLREIEYYPLTGGRQAIPRKPKYETGLGRYVKVSDNSCIDGMFIPDGKTKPVTISSAGHCFEACPDTTNLFYSDINILKNWKFHDPVQNVYEKYRKDAANQSLIYLHSNIGITFDLQKVRQASPNVKLLRFDTFVGTVRSMNNIVLGTTEKYSEYDVWVLVDGQLRFSAKAVRFDGGHEVSVELSDQDRFLSLIVTDGQTVYLKGKPANHFDTCGFADPVFKVELK